MLLIVLFSTNVYLLGGCIAIITLVAMFELFRATGIIKYRLLSIIGFIYGGIVMFFQFSGTSSFYGLLFIFVSILFLCMILGRGSVTFEHIACVFFVAVFVPVFFSQIVKVRLFENGQLLVFLIFIASLVSDAAALFVGRALGRHKFAPHISPNKTLEGAIGGVLGSVVGFVIFGIIVQLATDLTPVYPLLLLFGLLGGIVSEIGDLAASAIKREFGIKDYGDIMPGHGGVMDRFDSVLFVAPLMSLLLYNFTVLV